VQVMIIHIVKLFAGCTDAVLVLDTSGEEA
jgi:hypothetical protein